jgi:hypothetical protein
MACPISEITFDHSGVNATSTYRPFVAKVEISWMRCPKEIIAKHLLGSLLQIYRNFTVKI